MRAVLAVALLAAAPAVGFVAQPSSVSFGAALRTPACRCRFRGMAQTTRLRWTPLPPSANTLGRRCLPQPMCEVAMRQESPLFFPEAPPCPSDGIALVVFHGIGDLRVDDHAGLEAAASGRELHCLAVLDPGLLACMSDRRIKAVHAAVKHIRSSLAQLGIHLDVRLGETRRETAAVAAQVMATHVYVNHDPQASAQDALREITSGVTEGSPEVKVHLFSNALRTGELSANVKDFQAYQARICAPVTSLTYKAPVASREAIAARGRGASSLPAAGAMPTAEDMIAQAHGLRTPAQRTAFALRAESGGNLGDRHEITEEWAMRMWNEYQSMASERAFATKHLTPDSGSASLEMVAARVYGPAGYAYGEPFLRVFSEALELGCLSPRIVVRDCNERTYNAVWSQSPVPWVLEQRRDLIMAREALEAREWHRLQAIRDNAMESVSPDMSTCGYTYWRWKGFLIRYAKTTAAPDQAAASNRPAVVLVHGFGASSEQWDTMMSNLRAQNLNVWALDLLGFGHRLDSHRFIRSCVCVCVCVCV